MAQLFCLGVIGLGFDLRAFFDAQTHSQATKKLPLPYSQGKRRIFVAFDTILNLAHFSIPPRLRECRWLGVSFLLSGVNVLLAVQYLLEPMAERVLVDMIKIKMRSNEMMRVICSFFCTPLLLLAFVLWAQAADDEAAKPGGVDGTGTNVIYTEDVVYGRVAGAGLLADIAYPESKDPLPAIISVHGGRWQGGNKRDASSIDVRQWAGFGFFAMSIDYRLVDCTPPPACYQDLQCAIRYVHAHARQYNIDTNRIFLIGQSAGGHMVSLAATVGDGPFPRTGGWKAASNDIRAAISVAANYELTTLSWGDIWTPATGDPVEARKLASPVNHIRKDTKPLLILHSDNDRSVPIQNALLMVEALKEADASHVFHRYPSAGHMGITDEVIRRSRQFIKQQSAGNKR